MGDSHKKEKCLKKSNLLVYQQPTGQRTERKDDACKGVKVPICKPKAKQIRICTGAELRKMCPPKVCGCEPAKKTPFGLLKFLGFGLKSGVAAALIYITYDMGIWGTTDETQELYNSACHFFGSPKPKKNDKWDPPSCEAESELFTKRKHSEFAHCSEPPIQVEDTYLKFKKLWNGGVTTIFHGIANFPGNIIGTSGTMNKKGEEDLGPVCVPYSEVDEEDQAKIANQYK